MRTLRSASARSLVVESRTAGSMILVVPLLLVVLPLPWLFREGSSDLGLAASGVLALLILSFLRAARGTAIDVPVPEQGLLVLEPRPEDDDSTYRVYLESRDRTRALILEHHDPARVVGDLRRIVASTSLVLRNAWGLREETLLRPARARALRAAAPSIAGHVAPEQRNVAHALLGTAVFELGVVGWCAFHAPEPPSALSLAFGLGTVSLIALLGFWLRILRVRVSADTNGLLVEYGAGAIRRVRAFPRAELRGADAVGPAQGKPRHLLLDTSAGLYAVSLEPAAARAAAALFEEHARNDETERAAQAAPSHAEAGAP